MVSKKISNRRHHIKNYWINSKKKEFNYLINLHGKDYVISNFSLLLGLDLYALSYGVDKPNERIFGKEKLKNIAYSELKESFNKRFLIELSFECVNGYDYWLYLYRMNGILYPGDKNKHEGYKNKKVKGMKND